MNDRAFMFAQLAKPVEIVGVACGEGAQDKGSAKGPDALRERDLVSRLQTRGLSAAWQESIRPGRASRDHPLRAVYSVCRRRARGTALLL